MGGYCEMVSSGICGQQRSILTCASVQSDQDFHCPLSESFGTMECINELNCAEWMANRTDTNQTAPLGAVI